MGLGTIRAGAPVAPTTVTAGVEGTSAMEVSFPVPARPCYVLNQNADSEVLFVKINETGATATDCHIRLAANIGFDVSFGGLVAVESISLYAAANSPYDTVLIHGWTP